MDQERRYMNPYRALKNKYYRNFWIVQSVSLIGTWIDTTLRGWVAVNTFSESKASGFIGLIAFLKGFPSVFFSPIAGVLIDWFGPKNILLGSQIIDAVNAFIMAYLVWKGTLSPYVLLILSLAMGVTSGFYLPSRNTFISNIVQRELLPNALALHSMIFNVARMVGPTIAGFIVKSYGLQVGFIVNAISFVPLIVVLLFIPDNYSSSSEASFKKFFVDLREGVGYVIRNDVHLRTFVGLTMYSLFGMPFGMLMQAFVKSVVKYDILGYSLIMGMMGVGAFIGANVVASINSKRLINLREDFLLLIIGSSVLFAALLPRFAFVSAFIVGACQSSFFNITNSRTQLLSPSNMKGRTISLYSFINTGGSPTGTFILGILGNVVGVRNVYIFSGLILTIFSLLRLLSSVNPSKSRTTMF
ncbi:MAG: MFS transporter [Fervidobacterium sp.]|uniref:MFS transporter n=1 Tax=Fervidobacterium sp. TaxID=1871331 RepID=UPI00404B451C